MEYFGAIYSSDGVSDYLIATLTNSKYSVAGYITQGAMMNLSQSWGAPFAGYTLGSVAGALGDVEQVRKGETSISRFNTLLTWEGGQPPTFTLPITFLAQNDAYREVQGALAALLAMNSPNLKDASVGGRIPESVTLDIGRRIMIADLKLQDVSFSLDEPRTADGYFVKNVATLQLSGSVLYNADDYLTAFQ